MKNNHIQDHRIEFGKTLKNMRLNAGYSQGDVSKICGFTTPQLISNIERGACWPPMNVLSQMCELYKVKKNVMLDLIMECRKKVWSSELGISTRSK